MRLPCETAELHARSRLALSVSRNLAAVGTWLQMIPNQLALGSDRVDLSAKRCEARFTQAKLNCDLLFAETNQYRRKAETIETIAETVIERFGDIYQPVQRHGRAVTFLPSFRHRKAVLLAAAISLQPWRRPATMSAPRDYTSDSAISW